MGVWTNQADAQAGTAQNGTTYYRNAQGLYVEQWNVPPGAESVAQNIVDNAFYEYGPQFAAVTRDNQSQLMSTYIAKFGADTSNFQGIGEGAAGLGLAGTLVKKDTGGGFSTIDWNGYPEGVPVPSGPFQLIDGAEYDAARKDANAANSSIRQQQGLVGQPVDIHEVQPVKFGGSPTDPGNKVVLPQDIHRQQVTPWWNKLLKDLK
ncbi:hypothetical protein CBA19CS91_26090 [Paraburkholderia hospita]|nr:hypothetical protein CBA19CS91_26090 [Paraburkholderia hospita]